MAPMDAGTRERLARMLILIRRMTQVFDTGIEREDLTALRGNSEVVVGVELLRQGPRRPRDLQQVSGLTSGGLTKLFDRLEVAGIVQRGARSGDADGRAVEVRLTPSGRHAVRRLLQVVDDARDDCRPLAKEIVQLVEACGGGPNPEIEPCGELITCVSRLGLLLVEAVAGAPDAAPSIEYTSVLVLCHAELEGGCRPGGLMDLLDLSSGGVTKLLDRLEADGLVRREYGSVDADRRAVVVTATAQGRRVMLRALTRVARHLDELWLVNQWLAEGVTPTH